MVRTSSCRSIWLVAAVAASFVVGVAEARAQQKRSELPAFPSGRKVSFNFFPKDPSHALVREHWKKNGETAAIWSRFQEVPNFSIGLADLNGDGKPEIFARHSDELWGYCDASEYSCLMHVYVVTAQGLVEIGRMMASNPVLVLPGTTDGVRDIFVPDAGKADKYFKWNGKRYEPRP